MALDLEAIRRRVQELSGQRKNSRVQLWKPGLGEYKVRGLPSKNLTEGSPLTERWFYYFVNPGILTPKQFGKHDPIDDLIRKLFSSGKPDDRVMAKQLMPKMRAYMPVIVRGEEDKGVQLWSFGKPIYQRLLSFFLEDDYGDILDPNTGFDLKVTISHTPGKMFNGKPSYDTLVDARKQCKLSDDPEQVKKWLEEVPSIDDMYKLKSTAEIEQILNNWLSGGDAANDGTERSPKPTPDVLDELVNDVKKPTPVTETKSVKNKPRKPVIDDDAPARKTQSMEDAFKELEEESNDEL